MKHLRLYIIFILISSCTNDKEQAVDPAKVAEGTEKIEQDANTIEQAADKAAKLVEADAAAEVKAGANSN